MNGNDLFRDELRGLLAEREGLRAKLNEYKLQIESLSRELAETNSGVVALYAELDDKAVQLRDVSELKSRFLSYMSHEFRTPLGAIHSISRILLEEFDGPLTEEQKKQVNFIRSAADELTEMVNDLLDLAKIEAGRISVSPAWFEMVDLFATLRGMFKPLLTHAAVDLIFEEPHGIPTIFTDDKRLSQILRNFISNALKFTLKGEVRVSAESSQPDWVVFAVADTGIGIATEDQAALFQDFVQVDSPIQKKFRGAGLGLALSKRLAELLGGNVGVESEIGRGSVFSIRIPVYYRPRSEPSTGGNN
jgi:signal transduction histidine kinase